MEIIVSIFSTGADTGPFNIYSNIDGFATAFETNIPKSKLLNGYHSTNVPPGTSIIRVKNLNVSCGNTVSAVIS